MSTENHPRKISLLFNKSSYFTEIALSLWSDIPKDYFKYNTVEKLTKKVYKGLVKSHEKAHVYYRVLNDMICDLEISVIRAKLITDLEESLNPTNLKNNLEFIREFNQKYLNMCHIYLYSEEKFNQNFTDPEKSYRETGKIKLYRASPTVRSIAQVSEIAMDDAGEMDKLMLNLSFVGTYNNYPIFKICSE